GGRSRGAAAGGGARAAGRRSRGVPPGAGPRGAGARRRARLALRRRRRGRERPLRRSCTRALVAPSRARVLSRRRAGGVPQSARCGERARGAGPGARRRGLRAALMRFTALALLVLAAQPAWAEVVFDSQSTGITTAASGARAVRAADLDGDGDLDLVS